MSTLLAVFLSATTAYADSLPVPLSAKAAAGGTCEAFQHNFAPYQTLKSAEDGLGGWVVWVRDKDDDLWLCNTNDRGAVFVFKNIHGDLLAGRGEQAFEPGGPAAGLPTLSSVEVAESLCKAFVKRRTMQVVKTVEDGVGDYIVWLKTPQKGLWMCNASGNKKELYVFEPASRAINGYVAATFRWS